MAQADRRRLSLRASLIWFVLLSILVVAGAVAIVLLFDPRTQAWWGGRWSELATAVRAFFGR